jgi:hypothetical protein
MRIVAHNFLMAMKIVGACGMGQHPALHAHAWAKNVHSIDELTLPFKSPMTGPNRKNTKYSYSFSAIWSGNVF